MPFLVVYSLQAFQQEFCMHFIVSLCTPHARPFSFLLMWYLTIFGEGYTFGGGGADYAVFPQHRFHKNLQSVSFH
jgi:hypothetical protein